MPHRVKQRRFHPRNTCQHQRIALIALSFMLINRPSLARIGHNYFTSRLLQMPADPRTVTPCFHHHQSLWITAAQLTQGRSVVAHASFFQHFTLLAQHTKPVPPISHIQSNCCSLALVVLLFSHKAESLPNALASGTLCL